MTAINKNQFIFVNRLSTRKNIDLSHDDVLISVSLCLIQPLQPL